MQVFLYNIWFSLHICCVSVAFTVEVIPGLKVGLRHCPRSLSNAICWTQILKTLLVRRIIFRNDVNVIWRVALYCTVLYHTLHYCTILYCTMPYRCVRNLIHVDSLSMSTSQYSITFCIICCFFGVYLSET